MMPQYYKHHSNRTIILLKEVGEDEIGNSIFIINVIDYANVLLIA